MWKPATTGLVLAACALAGCSGQFKTGDAVYTRNTYMFGAFGTTHRIGFPAVSLVRDGHYEFTFRKAPTDGLTFGLDIQGGDPRALLEEAGTAVEYQLYRGDRLLAEASGALHQWRRTEGDGCLSYWSGPIVGFEGWGAYRLVLSIRVTHPLEHEVTAIPAFVGGGAL